MEIAIERDEEQKNFYTVTIKKDTVIQTLLSKDGRDYNGHQEQDLIVQQWVRQINKIHTKTKKDKKNQPLIVGLSADRSTNYANGSDLSSSDTSLPKNPYEILQICVGDHCLIYEFYVASSKYHQKQHVPKAINDLLNDNRTIVVGVKINEVAKKLENDYGLKISRPVDLQVLASKASGLAQGYYSKYGLERLAKVVLGDEWDLGKPTKMNWYFDHTSYDLSNEKIKYGAAEAFLAYEMGLKLWKDT